MGTITNNTRFVADHSGPGTPEDPNLVSPADIASFIGTDSFTVSVTTSQVVSRAASGALDSVPVSTADSKAVSAGGRASVADSKAISVSGTTSVADSKALSVSLNTSIADSKAVSVGAASVVPIIGGIPGFQQTGTGSVIRAANSKMAEQISVDDFGAYGDGVRDDTTAIVNAIAAAVALGGGDVLLAAGKQYKFSTPLDLSSLSKVTLRTRSDREGIAAAIPEPATLLYAGTGTASAIVLSHAQAVSLLGLGIRYNNSGFTGYLIDCTTGGVGSDTSYIRIKNCALGGTLSTINGSKALIGLNGCIISSIEECTFEWADRAIWGVTNAYANAITVAKNTFRALNLYSIYNMGQAWDVVGNTFEANVGNVCTFFDDDGTGTGKAVTISKNWMGDVNSGSNYCIRGKFFGLIVSGNEIAINATNSGAVSLKAGSEGILVQGNRGECTFGVKSEGLYAYGVIIGPNSWQIASPNEIVNPSNFQRGFYVGDGNRNTEFFGLNSPVVVRDDGTITVDAARDVVGMGLFNTLPAGSLGAYFAVLGGGAGYGARTLGILPPAESHLAGKTALFGATGGALVESLEARSDGAGPVSSAYNGPHLTIGAYHLWVDSSNRLRIKASQPTSDTDGTVVGTQA